MRVKILLRGTLKKLFEDKPERDIDVPNGSTCEEALMLAGINWRETKNFGFVAVNGKRVMITDVLHDGDELKAFSKVSGG